MLTTAVFDYDTDHTYNIGVQVTDALGVSFESNFTINVTYVPPPAVTAVTAFVVGMPSIRVAFSEPVVGADQLANYQLIEAGPDGLLGTADDISVPVSSVSYSGTFATLESASLSQGLYRLIVSNAITSPTGEALDGNGNGHPGSEYVQDLAVPVNPVVNLTSANGFTFPVQAGGDGAGQVIEGTNNAFAAVTRLQVGGTDYAPVMPAYTVAEEQDQSLGTIFSTSSTTPVLSSLSETFTTLGGPVRLAAQLSFASPGTGNAQTGNNLAAAQLVLNGVPIGLPQYSGAADAEGWEKFLPIDLAVYVPSLAAGSYTLGVNVWSVTGHTLYQFPAQDGAENQLSAVEIGSVPGFGLVETAHEQDLAATFQSSSTTPVAVPGLSETFNTGGGPLRLTTELTAYLPNSYSDAAAQLIVDGTPVGMPQFAGSDTNSITQQYVTFDVAAYLSNFAAGSHTVGVLIWSPTGEPTLLNDTLENHLSAVEIGPSYGLSEVAHEQDLTTTFQTNSSTGFVPVPGLSETFTTSGGPVRLTAELTALDGFNFNVPEAELLLDGVGVGAIETSGLRTYNAAPQYATFDLEAYLPSLAAGTHTLDVGIATTDGYTVSLPSNLLNHVSAVEFLPIPVASLSNNGSTLVTPQESLAGLDVEREVTVPTNGSQDFARTVDYYQNPTSNPIATAVHLVADLGSASAAQVFATSSGDSSPSPSDEWIGTDGGPGTTAVIIRRARPAGLLPTTEDIVGDSIEWTYNITVGPGQTLELATFTIQGSSEDTAIAEANALLRPTASAARQRNS